MRKLIDRVEWIAWAAFILGIGAKWSLLPIGNILLTIGLLTLALVYFLPVFLPPASATENSRNPFQPVAEASSFLLDILVPKLVSISSTVTFLGVLFKLMHLPGSANLLLVGTATLLMVLVVLALHQRMSTRVLVVAALGGLLLYSSSETLVRQFHRNDPVLVEKLVYQLQHPQYPMAAKDVHAYLQQKRANP